MRRAAGTSCHKVSSWQGEGSWRSATALLEPTIYVVHQAAPNKAAIAAACFTSLHAQPAVGSLKNPPLAPPQLLVSAGRPCRQTSPQSLSSCSPSVCPSCHCRWRWRRPWSHRQQAHCRGRKGGRREGGQGPVSSWQHLCAYTCMYAWATKQHTAADTHVGRPHIHASSPDKVLVLHHLLHGVGQGHCHSQGQALRDGHNNNGCSTTTHTQTAVSLCTQAAAASAYTQQTGRSVQDSKPFAHPCCPSHQMSHSLTAYRKNCTGPFWLILWMGKPRLITHHLICRDDGGPRGGHTTQHAPQIVDYNQVRWQSHMHKGMRTPA